MVRDAPGTAGDGKVHVPFAGCEARLIDAKWMTPGQSPAYRPTHPPSCPDLRVCPVVVVSQQPLDWSSPGLLQTSQGAPPVDRAREGRWEPRRYRVTLSCASRYRSAVVVALYWWTSTAMTLSPSTSAEGGSAMGTVTWTAEPMPTALEALVVFVMVLVGMLLLATSTPLT